jgi:hypothetical protein
MCFGRLALIPCKLEGNEAAYLGLLSVACLYRGNLPKDYRGC